MLSSVGPITSLSSTFSNYPRPSMVGQQRRCMKPFLLASARVGPSCRLMGVQNYHVLFRSCHALVLPCPLSAIKHSSFFAPYTLSPLHPSHALLRGNEWVAVAETKYDALVCWPNHVSVIDLQQLSTSFDGRTAKEVCETLSPSFCMHWPFMQIDGSPKLSCSFLFSPRSRTSVSSLRHQAFLLFCPIYALTLAPITCPLAWQRVGRRCGDKV